MEYDWLLDPVCLDVSDSVPCIKMTIADDKCIRYKTIVICFSVLKPTLQNVPCIVRDLWHQYLGTPCLWTLYWNWFLYWEVPVGNIFFHPERKHGVQVILVLYYYFIHSYYLSVLCLLFCCLSLCRTNNFLFVLPVTFSALFLFLITSGLNFV